MPELPEVETTVRLIRPAVIGRRIQAVEAPWPRTLGGLEVGDFTERVSGARIAAVWRRAKQIVFDPERRGKSCGHLAVHLRMTGGLIHLPPPKADGARNGGRDERFLRARFRLDDGGELGYMDLRKLGTMWLVADESSVVGKLGPEPLGAAFDPRELRRPLSTRSAPVQSALMYQHSIAGCGNISAADSPFAARVPPPTAARRPPRGPVEARAARPRPGCPAGTSKNCGSRGQSCG